MDIGVIGTGNMGTGLALRLARAGHDVFLGSRDPERGREIGRRIGGGGGGYREAAEHGDVVVLAVPWWSIDGVLPQLDLSAKILIDCTNPVMGDDGALQPMGASSAAQEIARQAPGARLVKCFNHIVAEVIHLDRSSSPSGLTAFLCGDDAGAKGVVGGLVSDIGFDPVDVGPLAAAQLLESVAGLMLQLTRAGTVPPDGAIRLVSSTPVAGAATRL